MPQPFQPNSQHPRRAFTLIEVLVVLLIASVVSIGLYAIMQAGMTVGARSLAINNTGNASRLSLDRMEQYLQIAYNTPTLLTRTGTPHNDSSTPAAGVRFFRYVAAPYEITIPSSGLSGDTTTLTIFARRDSGSSVNQPPAPPEPQPNDILVINTTILMSKESSQIMGHVREITARSSASRTSSSGSTVAGTSYTVSLSKKLTENGGLIPSGSVNTVTATLIRPTAFVVVPVGDSRELRLYESFPNDANLDLTGTHSVITDQVAWASSSNSASASDTFATPFFVRKLGGRTFIDSNLRIRDNRYDRYLSSSNRHEFSTFNVLHSRVPVKCNPNE